jgi:hypothetical protein
MENVMKERKIILIGILLVTTLACRIVTPEPKEPISTEARTYENEIFSFTIPAGWQTNEEIWESTITPGTDYLGLGVEEIISIQYPPHQGRFGGCLTVASSSLASGEDLESRFTQTYEYIIPEMKNVSKQLFERGTLSGLEITYQRPVGEPWWQFHDIWLEKDGSIYVLSFHTLTNGFEDYAAIFDQILDSFQFKE